MPEFDSQATTDPSGAPTQAEMDAMILAHRRAEEDAEILATWKRQSDAAKRAIYGEAA